MSYFLEKCCPVCGKYYIDQSINMRKSACSPKCRYEFYWSKQLIDTVVKRALDMRINVLRNNGCNISAEERLAIEEKLKEGYCEICGNKFPIRLLHIDHDHKNGKFRGVLCHNCNFALGNVKDDIEILHKLVDYLMFHNKELEKPCQT
jgi:hypothetical protein